VHEPEKLQTVALSPGRTSFPADERFGIQVIQLMKYPDIPTEETLK
jgi:hypothetical protein